MVRWIPAFGNRPAAGRPAAGRPVAGLSLAPGQYILVGIPLRISGTCYEPGTGTGTDAVYVQERYLFFTHWVAVRLQQPLILQQPFKPGTQPAKDFVCLRK